jgi:hypothetical protein
MPKPPFTTDQLGSRRLVGAVHSIIDSRGDDHGQPPAFILNELRVRHPHELNSTVSLHFLVL